MHAESEGVWLRWLPCKMFAVASDRTLTFSKGPHLVNLIVPQDTLAAVKRKDMSESSGNARSGGIWLQLQVMLMENDREEGNGRIGVIRREKAVAKVGFRL